MFWKGDSWQHLQHPVIKCITKCKWTSTTASNFSQSWQKNQEKERKAYEKLKGVHQI